MVKKLTFILFCLLLFTGQAYAVRPTTRITIEPLEEISFNTVAVGTTWVTANTGLINRKAINIFNLSDSEIVYIAQSTTANTASITNSKHLFPRAGITYGLGSKNNIYVSCDSTVFVTFTEIR